MATNMTEADIAAELDDKETIGFGQYTTFQPTKTIERNIYWSREPSLQSTEERPVLSHNDLSDSPPIIIPLPSWDHCEHERFEYFCDIYLAVIATLVTASLRLTLLMPSDTGHSLHDHLSRLYVNTTWPAVIVNGIVITIGYLYTITVWQTQIKVLYLYPILDTLVIWLNIGMLASMAFIPISAILFNVSLESIVPGFFCFSTTLASIFQCAHIIYAYVCNYFDSFHDESHENSNIIVLFLQLHSALDIPLRLMFGFALSFVPEIGGILMLIVYLLTLTAPFDYILIEKIFIHANKKSKHVDLIIQYLQHFKKKLSLARFVHFTDGVVVMLIALLLIDLIGSMSRQAIILMTCSSNLTTGAYIPELFLRLDKNNFYSFVWGIIVTCSFWLVSYHMYFRVKMINRIIVFLKFFALFFACFIPLCTFLLAEYAKSETYNDMHLAIVISLSLVTWIGILQLILLVYMKYCAKSLKLKVLSHAHDFRMLLLIINIPLLSFILIVIELIAINSLDLLKIFIIFMVTVPVTIAVETLPNIHRFLGKYYNIYGDRVVGSFYRR